MQFVRSFATAAATGVLTAALIAPLPPAAYAQNEAPPARSKIVKSCHDDPDYHLLDFWLGSWDVKIGEKLVGTNVIEKTLRGCAVIEQWSSREGGEGMSLFYYDPGADTWKQVWITDAAYSQGGLKEKQLVERMNDGSLRFQGTITTPNGGSYLDRTTLVPRRDGTVRQMIEISTDDGFNWTRTFDAIYVRTAGPKQGVWRKK